MEQELIQVSPEVLDEIRSILTDFEVQPGDVVAATEFAALGLDSLDIVEVSVRIEDVFGIEVDDEDLAEVRTVGDAATLVAAKLAARA